MFGCVFHDSLKSWLPIWSSCSAGSRGWVWFLHSLIPRKDTASRGCVLTRLACHSSHKRLGGDVQDFMQSRDQQEGSPAVSHVFVIRRLKMYTRARTFLPKCTWLCQLYRRAQGGGDASPPRALLWKEGFLLRPRHQLAGVCVQVGSTTSFSSQISNCLHTVRRSVSLDFGES